MRFLVLFAVLIILFSFCLNPKQNMVEFLNLCVKYPIVNIDSSGIKCVDYFDTIPIYHYRDYAIYMIPIRGIFQRNDSMIHEEKKFKYFFFNKHEKYGYLFKSLQSDEFEANLNIDSFLFKRAYAAKFDNKNKTLVSRQTDTATKISLNTYIPQEISDDYQYDTIYFYHDKSLNNIEYTFSRVLDSIERKKLFKVRILYNSKYLKQYQKFMPKREMSFEIKKGVSIDSNEMIKTFEDLIRKIS
ncbi:MAG: hypothetical protein ACK4E8_12365 [Lacibacter sp.]